MVTVKRLELTHFMSDKNRTVEFPSSGVVLVVGPNGSGKSTIVEAVAHACWNKSLRSETGWWDDVAGRIVAQIDDLQVTRSRGKRGATKLEVEGQRFPTSAKLQDWLTSRIGTFENWRRTSVFSCADPLTFSGSTDAERKRLLEALVGVNFDAALSTCRRDLREARTVYQDAQHTLQLHRTRLSGARQRLEDAHELQPAPTCDERALRVERPKLQRRIEMLRDEVDELVRTKDELISRQRVANLEVTRIRRDIERLAGDECPMCQQSIPLTLRVALEDKYEQAVASEHEVAFATEQELSKVLQEHGEAAQELLRLRDRAATIEETLRAHLADEARRASAQRIRDELENEICGLENEILQLKSDLEAQRSAVAELEVVEQVLGLSGVRAHLFSRALAALESVCTAYLQRIAAPGYTLQIRPFAEKADGELADRITLTVTTPKRPKPHAYAAASSGERRRFDVALTLGLASLVDNGSSTLFFDEVFDNLDALGVERVAALLRSLSTDRCVVVISHNDALQRLLKPTLTLRTPCTN